MRSIKLKQNASIDSVALTIQNDRVPNGWSKDRKILTIEVANVPDGVNDYQVLHLYSQTAVFHRPDSEHVVDFKDLIPGKILQVGPSANVDAGLINSITAAKIIGITKQAVRSMHLASSKDTYRGKFPKAAKTDPDGGNPWFVRSEIEAYSEQRNPVEELMDADLDLDENDPVFGHMFKKQ